MVCLGVQLGSVWVLSFFSLIGMFIHLLSYAGPVLGPCDMSLVRSTTTAHLNAAPVGTSRDHNLPGGSISPMPRPRVTAWLFHGLACSVDHGHSGAPRVTSPTRELVARGGTGL